MAHVAPLPPQENGVACAISHFFTFRGLFSLPFLTLPYSRLLVIAPHWSIGFIFYFFHLYTHCSKPRLSPEPKFSA